MTRSRHRSEPYWVHSNPEAPEQQIPADVPDLAAYAALAAKACPGDCNGRWRKRAHAAALGELQMAEATRAEPVPYEPDLAMVRRAVSWLVLGDPVWCSLCAQEIRSATGSLEAMISTLRRMPLGQLAPTPASEVKPASRTLPSPSPAFDLADQIERWPGEWTPKLAEHMDEPVKPTYASLWGRWPALMSAPFAQAFGKDALQLHRRALAAAGVDELVHRYPKHPCIDCQRRALSRRDGADRVQCGACGASWPWQWFEEVALAFNRATG